MRCWLCGVEPDDFVEVTAFTGPVREIPAWPPAADHTHAERPPSPAQLEKAGHEALMRIVELTDPRPASERLRLPTEAVG